MVDRLAGAVLRTGSPSAGSSLARRLGHWSTHRWLGLPILVLVLLACYQFVGVLGAGVCVDFLEETVFHGHLLPWTDRLVRAVLPEGAVQAFLVGPAGVPYQEHGGFLLGRYGLLSMGLSYGMAIVLPIVATFFVAFSVLEDSGYLPRLAVMVNRLFKAMGLNGKAVLPMVLGLGCDTMATMTARIMETRKERVIVTLLLALAVPCSAQMAVILAMTAHLPWGATAWFAGAILATLLLVGWLAAKVLPGRGSDFVLELPPLRIPQAGNVATKTVARIELVPARGAAPLPGRHAHPLRPRPRGRGRSCWSAPRRRWWWACCSCRRRRPLAFIMGFLRRDYAAAGLFLQYEPYFRAGALPREAQIEVTVALVTLTLFIPCIAQLFMILKERGWRTGLAIAGFVVPFALAMGGAVNFLMRRFY